MESPMKTLAVLHHMHRARLPHTSQVRCHLTLFILSCCVGRSFFGASEIGHTRCPTDIFAHACPVKTLALLHHMHRAQLPRMSSVRSNLTLFIASWYAGRYGCSLKKLNRLFTLGGQLNDLLMPASRSDRGQFVL